VLIPNLGTFSFIALVCLLELSTEFNLNENEEQGELSLTNQTSVLRPSQTLIAARGRSSNGYEEL